MDLPTWFDLFRIARDEAVGRNAKIAVEQVERDGTDTNIIVAAAVAAADEVVGQLIHVEAANFLDSARGQALVRLVFDRYGLTKKPASSSVGSALFQTVSPAAGTFTIPTGTIVQTADGMQFVTTSAGIFLAGSSSLLVAIRSAQAGLGQRAKIGAITSVVSQITNQPTDLTVTNVAATVGDDDEESDESLRNRARNFFPTARRGTLEAIRQGALAVPGVRTADAFEVLDTMGRSNRLVLLVVSDAFTESLVDAVPTPPVYAAQSQMFSTTVFNALSDVRAGGIYVQVNVAQVVMLPSNLSLTFHAGVNADAVAEQARAAVVNYTNALNPGATWRVVDVVDALRLVPGLVVTGNEIQSPAGDVVPKPLQVIRTTMGFVNAVSAQPNRLLTGGGNPDAFVFTGAFILGA